MKEYLNENTLYNSVAMYLDESDSFLLVVEGPDDHLMLKGHCSQDMILIVGTGGRGQVLKTAALAKKRSLSAVRFLVDRDYDDYKDTRIAGLDNVFVSEWHDCFLDVLKSGPATLHKVIDVHTASARRDPKRIVSIPTPEQIESQAMSLASYLAAVRVVDARRGLALDFKRFAFGGLKVTEFDVRVIAELVLVRSGYDVDNRAEIIEDAVRTHSEFCALPQIPVGDHDLFAALARILRGFRVSVSDDVLQRGFILAVSCGALNGTKWFRQIQDWCTNSSRIGFTCESGAAVAA